jgi:transposase-like protein
VVTKGFDNMSLITKIKVFFGAEVCPHCGSKDIIISGFENVNLRYKCKQCETTTYIDGFPL